MSPVLTTEVAIVGTGYAGYTLAREYRRIVRDRQLVLLSQDDACSYSKPLLSTAFAMGLTPGLLRASESAQMQRRLNGAVMSNQTVMAIDRDRRELALASGLALRYEKLVLAVGAYPLSLSLNGNAASTVVSVNDLAAYARLRELLVGARRVTIIGAGLVGCEFANDLALAGYEVDLLDMAARPLARLLPPLAAAAVATALVSVGVHWHPARGVTDLWHLPSASGGPAYSRYTLSCTDGTALTSDLVISAIGLRSRTELAEAAGLKINRGIVVDRQLRTSDANIYALGDCAEVNGQVSPYITPITHGARVLAGVLNGHEALLEYPVMPIEVKIPACPALVVQPPLQAVGQWVTEIDDGPNTCAFFVDMTSTLRGYAITGYCIERNADLMRCLGLPIPKPI